MLRHGSSGSLGGTETEITSGFGFDILPKPEEIMAAIALCHTKKVPVTKIKSVSLVKFEWW